MLDIFLLVSRDDEYTINSINSFLKIETNPEINKYISITKKIINTINLNKQSLENTKIIEHDFKFKTAREHVENLVFRAKGEYVMHLHDDDIFGKDIAIDMYKIIKKFKPKALSCCVTYINEDSRILSERQKISSNKIKKISPNKLLSGYFLPFERPLVLPTVIFKRKDYIKYWERFKYSMGKHEDVRILFFFAKQGLFLEYQKSCNYFYRYTSHQDSSIRNETDRLKLISWLKSLNINSFYKFSLVLSSYIQYYLFYKNFDSLLPKLKKILNTFRKIIIFKRQGGKPGKKIDF